MFDAVGAFKKQFTPVEGGYLIYPSRKAGGKFVTVEEYEQLVYDWERTAGGSGVWKVGGIATVAIVLWTLFERAFSTPEWSNQIVIGAIVVAIVGWLLWASFAPRRLVKDRAPIAPIRPIAEARREARAGLNWPFILFALLLSGGAFLRAIMATERTVGEWAWLVGSGAMFGAYIWIGAKKLMDRRS